MCKTASDLPAATSNPQADLPPTAGLDQARAFHRHCLCATLDRNVLSGVMDSVAGDRAFYETHVASRPHLFSDVPVFLKEADRAAMTAIIGAIESTVSTRFYREAVLQWAPDASRQDFGPGGALMGYDFHLGTGPPRLIEINTNAGGAFLNALVAQAQTPCCHSVEPCKHLSPARSFDEAIVRMFESEWRRQRGTGRPARIVILDDTPEAQYLYPEFVIAKRMFEAHGFEAVIADPVQLTYSGGKLLLGEQVVDLVYNRLVDFALAEPRHAALRLAYLDGAVVVTPNPNNHAVFADKRNLTVLSDQALLQSWAIPAAATAILSALPRSLQVTPANAEQLWADRRRLFFKPVSGHGGKAVYRGEKLTKSVWETILKEDYIAQDFVPPGERQIHRSGISHNFKMDVRLYTYDGSVLLAAARLYQGQTTNFRTEGGGFAPVSFI